MDDPKATSRYARACQECATTKAKCIRQTTGINKCTRCARLNKECRARLSTTRVPRPPKPTRLTQMEEKLDGLVTLLAASQPQAQPSSAVPDSHPVLTPNSLSPDTRTCDFGPIQIPLISTVQLEERAQHCSCSGKPSQDGPSKDSLMGIVIPGPRCENSAGGKNISVLDLKDEVAAALLVNYQASMANYFPFVVIPYNTTAQHLRISKPYLFLSVMAVSSYQKTGQQTTLSTEIVRLLCEKMLLKGEKNLDLLQGVLIYVEWYHSHRLMDQQLTNMLQLSIALLVDLGLNKAPYSSERYQMVTETTKLLHGNSVYSQVRTNDERRALLGCFYLTSAISSCLKKLDAIRYTTHIEESCNVLSQIPEYKSDIYLVQLVKLQQIGEQITHNLPSDAPQSFWTLKPPVAMLVKAIQTELNSFKESLPQTLEHDPSIVQHLQSSEIHLFEISLCDQSRQHPSTHVQTLHSALLAASSFLQTFLSLPVSSYSSLPFITWAQALHAMQVLSKLSLLTDVPGWELSHVREIVDFSSLLDEMGSRFEEARNTEDNVQSENNGAGSRYDLYTQRIRRVKAWYEGKLAALVKPLRMRQDNQDDDDNDGDNADGNGNGNGNCNGNSSGNGHIGIPPGPRDDFLTSSTPGLEVDPDDAYYWHDFLGEWGTFMS